MKKSSKHLAWILPGGVFILLPFIFAPHFQDVEQSPRFLVLSIISFITLSGLLTGNKLKDFEIPVSRIWIFIGFAFFFLIIAALRTYNFGDGWYLFLKPSIYFILFILFIQLFRTEPNSKELLLKCVNISVLIFIATGVYQYFVEYFTVSVKKEAFVVTKYITSSFGNKNFFAEALIMMLPICTASFFILDKKWKYIAAVNCILILFAILYLKSLAVILALLTGITITSAVVVIYRNILFEGQNINKYIKPAVLTGLALVAACAFLFIRSNPSLIRGGKIESVKEFFSKGKIEQNFAQNSFAERLILFSNTLKISGENPAWGYGLGNWKILIPEYDMGNAAYMQTGETRIVHPHNEFLFIASEQGYLSLAAHLAIIFIVFYYLLKLIHTSTSKNELIYYSAWLILLLSLGVIAMFSIPLTRVYPGILLSCAAAVALHGYSEKYITDSYRLNGTTIQLIVIFLITIAAAGIYTGYKKIVGEAHFSNLIYADKAGNYRSVASEAGKIDRIIVPMDDTGTPIAWYGGYGQFHNNRFEKAFELFKEAYHVNPNHLFVLNDLGTCYNLSGNQDSAMILYNRAITLQPGFDKSLVNLAIIEYNKGNTESAYHYLLKNHLKIRLEYLEAYKVILSSVSSEQVTDSTRIAELNRVLKNQFELPMLMNDLRKYNSDFNRAIDENIKYRKRVKK